MASTNKEVHYAVVNKQGRIVIDFGSSEDLMNKWIEQYRERYKCDIHGIPSKITKTTIIEPLR